MVKKIDIRELSIDQLKEQLTSLGEKPFRAKQIYHWIWQKNVGDFDEMTTLSKELREILKEHFSINKIRSLHRKHLL